MEGTVLNKICKRLEQLKLVLDRYYYYYSYKCGLLIGMKSLAGRKAAPARAIISCSSDAQNDLNTQHVETVW